MTTVMAGATSVQILSTGEHELWRSLLPASRSVFGSVEFTSLAQEYLGYEARLLVFGRGHETITYPLFLRPISDLPFAVKVETEFWDAVSPEYTGPFTAGTVTRTTADSFRRQLVEYCRQERIIAEFAHLHPWNGCPDLLAPEHVFLDREIAYVDLTWSEDQLWQNSFTHACRKNIQRAHRENVRVFPATSLGDVEEFYRIYTQTMHRNQALAKYNFPFSYFQAFFESMANNARFVLAEYCDRIVAGTLYLHDDLDVYSYLGGADHDFQQVRPTNAVVYETIRWARQRCKKRLVLGGGYRPDDGIFRFKASFSPLRAKFYVHKRIHLTPVYDALCRSCSEYYSSDLGGDGYFPAYRWAPPAREPNPISI